MLWPLETHRFHLTFSLGVVPLSGAHYLHGDEYRTQKMSQAARSKRNLTPRKLEGATREGGEKEGEKENEERRGSDWQPGHVLRHCLMSVNRKSTV